MSDAINPKHYTQHPSKIECIQVTRILSFNRGNAIKYLWRLGQKDESQQELKKVAWYIRDEINNQPCRVYSNLEHGKLCALLDTLALYQDDNTRQLFNYIVFGNRIGLTMALDMVLGMME